MASGVSLGPVYTEMDWKSRPGELFKELEATDASLQEQLQLSEDEELALANAVERCNAIVGELEKFINPFIKASVHPLLGQQKFFDIVERVCTRDDSILNLWKTLAFKGCCALADERTLTEQEPTYREEFQFELADVNRLQWLEGSKANEVIKLLENYLTEESLDEQDTLRVTINKIFFEIQQYLEDSRWVFRTNEFKNKKFIDVTLTFLEPGSSLEEKIGDVFVACSQAESGGAVRNSRSSTPFASPTRNAPLTPARSLVSLSKHCVSKSAGNVVEALRSLKEIQESEKSKRTITPIPFSLDHVDATPESLAPSSSQTQAGPQPAKMPSKEQVGPSGDPKNAGGCLLL